MIRIREQDCPLCGGDASRQQGKEVPDKGSDTRVPVHAGVDNNQTFSWHGEYSNNYKGGSRRVAPCGESSREDKSQKMAMVGINRKAPSEPLRTI